MAMNKDWIRVLLIEDDEEDYLITRDIFDDIPGHRYKLFWVSSYEEGLKAIQERVYDIYLIDYQLGKENGLKLIEAARSDKLSIPVILLTGNNDMELDMEAMKLGAADFLVKGQISHNILDRSIRYAIQLNNTINELHSSKALAQTYFEMAGSIIVVIEENEVVHSINKEGCSVLGFSEAEIIGKNWFSHFIPEKEREDTRKVFSKIINGELEHVEYFENFIQTKENGTRLIRWYNRLLRDEDRQIIATISSGVDVTEQRKASEYILNYTQQLEKEVKAQTAQLLLHEAKLVQASKLAKVGYWEIDFKGEEPVFHYSKEYCSLYEVDHFDEKDHRYFLQFVHPEDRERVVETTKQAITQQMDELFDYRVITAKGKECFFRAMVKCIKAENGDLETLFTVVQNITEQKQSALLLEQSLHKERELGQLKSRFVSMASHEFRTPLSSIMSSVSLIEMYQEKGVLDKQVRHIKRIQGAVNSLTSILNDFLSLDKLESGKIAMSIQAIDMNEFMIELTEEVQPMLKSGQTISHQHEGEDSVLIDAHLLKNILINLLSNAIKYSPENSPVLIHSSGSKAELKIDVIDKGMGIPAEEQKHMFTRFFRANNVSSIQGTGLGLTIVKRYLELMGGQITFVSDQQRGTTFTLLIPMV